MISKVCEDAIPFPDIPLLFRTIAEGATKAPTPELEATPFPDNNDEFVEYHVLPSAE
jgi:hypothetical protein